MRRLLQGLPDISGYGADDSLIAFHMPLSREVFPSK